VLGYNGWLAATMSHQAGAANQTIYYKIADKLVESGLAAAGYDTILVVCNGFHRDPVTAKLQVNPDTWPDGFKALVDYAHAKTPPLKVGAYTDTGAINCCPAIDYPGHRNGPGSFGHEELDVQQFADWGVDHVAVDNCGNPDGGDQSIFEYAAFHDALVKVNKPMVYGIWAVGLGKPWAWANKLGHYWRTANDLGNRWGQDTDAQAGGAGVMYNYGIQQAIPSIAEISGPGESIYFHNPSQD
jgi:alpha-galactosidase